MEARFAPCAKFEFLQTQHGEAAVFPHKRPVNYRIERQQALQRDRPGNAQLQLHAARQFLIALKADRFVAEISRPACSVIGAIATPVGKLKLDVQLIPGPQPGVDR